MQEPFRKFATAAVALLTSGRAFLVVLTTVLLSGWAFGFSDRWFWWLSFFMTTSSFVLLFLLRKAQAVGDKATQLKLDELIRAIEGARNHIAAVEERSEGEIEELRKTTLDEAAAARRMLSFSAAKSGGPHE